MNVCRCAQCGAQVVRVQTMSGHPMWVDAEPAPEGTIIIRDGIGIVVSKETSAFRHRPHRATCPARTSGPSDKALHTPQKSGAPLSETATDPTDPSIPAPEPEPEPEPDDEDGDDE